MGSALTLELLPKFEYLLSHILFPKRQDISGFIVIIDLFQKLYLLVQNLLLLVELLDLQKQFLVLLLVGCRLFQSSFAIELGLPPPLLLFIKLKFKPLALSFFGLQLSLENLYAQAQSALLPRGLTVIIAAHDHSLSQFSVRLLGFKGGGVELVEKNKRLVVS